MGGQGRVVFCSIWQLMLYIHLLGCITLSWGKFPPSRQMMAVPFEAMLMPVHYAPSSVGFEASLQAWEFRL